MQRRISKMGNGIWANKFFFFSYWYVFALSNQSANQGMGSEAELRPIGFDFRHTINSVEMFPLHNHIYSKKLYNLPVCSARTHMMIKEKERSTPCCSFLRDTCYFWYFHQLSLFRMCKSLEFYIITIYSKILTLT